jgi:16S rRNA (guanine(966)-N(2))-methyltransferase RsmD
MRILTGKYKGKPLKMPKGIRPTQNKVRKAIFDILGDVEGLSFLELFAGSGAVGLEALSRGVAELVLVENSRQNLPIIRANIEMFSLSNYELLPMEAEEAIGILAKNKRKFEIIFLDPPYYQGLPKKTLQLLSACDILAAAGFIIIQHFTKDNLPDEMGGLILLKRYKYGSTLLSLYQHVPESNISR